MGSHEIPPAIHEDVVHYRSEIRPRNAYACARSGYPAWLDIGGALIALILLALPGSTRAVTVLPFLWDESSNDLPNVTAWH